MEHSSPNRAAGLRPFFRTAAFHLLFLSASTIALYALGLRNGFVADDESEVLQNPIIRSFHGIPQMFTHSVWFFLGGKADRYYRPLKLLAYSVEYHLFQFRPAWWHLANILFNLAAVLVIYFLVRDLAGTASLGADRQLAFWSALLFAFHPIHVEAVAWIAGGNDLLCGLGLLPSLWLYHRARSGGGARLLNYGLSVALFLTGLLFKETALTFPAVLLCYDFFYRRESLREMVRAGGRYAPYFAALGIYLMMRWRAIGGFAPNNPALGLTKLQFLLTVPVLAAEYLWKTLAPVGLNAWYTFHTVSSLGWRPAAATAVMAFLVWAMFRLRRSQGLLSLALAWFWLTLAPVLDIPKLGYNVFTERYLYIPTFGFCVLAAWGWLWLLKRASQPLTRRLAYAGVAGLVVFYSLVVVRRLPVWSSSATLWEQTARQDPDDPVVVNAAGTALYRAGRYPQALELFQRALALAPGESYTHNSLGGAYFVFHRYDDALREFQKAVALSPDTGNYWRNLGVAYANKNMWPEAVAAFQHAVERFRASAPPILTSDAQSTLTSLYIQYGTALLREGQTGPAVDAFENAVKVNSANLDARIRLSEALMQQGQLDTAADQIVQGLNAEPGSPQAYLAHYYLGRIYRQKGMQEAANQETQKALELNAAIGATPLGTSSLQLVVPEQAKKR